MADVRYLADFIPKRRVITIPIFDRYDLDNRDTWGMHLRDDEYYYDARRDNESVADYGLPPGEIQYDDELFDDESGEESDEENDDESNNEGDEQGEVIEIDESIMIREAFRRSMAQQPNLGKVRQVTMHPLWNLTPPSLLHHLLLYSAKTNRGYKEYPPHTNNKFKVSRLGTISTTIMCIHKCSTYKPNNNNKGPKLSSYIIM